MQVVIVEITDSGGKRFVGFKELMKDGSLNRTGAVSMKRHFEVIRVGKGARKGRDARKHRTNSTAARKHVDLSAA